MLRISPVMQIGQHLPNPHIKSIVHPKPKQDKSESFQEILMKTMNKNQVR